MTIRQRFKSAIRRGTGETHLIMMANPKMDFSSDITKAALINYAYDSQSEGSRSDYVFELIELSKQKEKIKKKILDKLLNEKEDTWALDQLFDIAALFAKQGKIFEKDSEEWEDSFMVDFFQEDNPEIKVYDELEKAAIDNKYIRLYLETIKKNKFKRAERKKPVYNYQTVKDRVDKNVMVPLPPVYAKDLSDSDIEKLADDFLKSKTRTKQEKYLRVFDRVKYPLDFKDLLTQAKRPYSSKDRLVEYAVNSLRYFTNQEIREFALEKLNGNISRPDIYTNLLIGNYKDGDSELLTKIVNKARNEHQIHDLVFSFVDIFQANKTVDCKKPLMALYNKLTCGLHREDIVRIMIENKVLPDKIREEIKYDSLDSTREL